MKKYIIVILFICIFSDGFSQQNESRKLGSFSELSVSEAISVTLVPGSSEKAVIEVSGTGPENVLTDISGNHLSIHMARGNWRNVDVEVILTYRELEEIEISSAAKVWTDAPIRSGKLEIDVSSAAKGDLTIEAGSLNIDINSAGNLDLKGSVDKLEADLSSAGHLNAYNLTCKDAEIEVSSAGSVKITITGMIDAHASSGGNIQYKGNPQKVYVHSSSGGSIKKQN